MKSMDFLLQIEDMEDETILFDYENQAWTSNGVYIRCGHPETMDCRCFGKIHENQPVKDNAYLK